MVASKIHAAPITTAAPPNSNVEDMVRTRFAFTVVKVKETLVTTVTSAAPI